MEYVIVGNSAGAIGCIEGIRQVDKTGHITLISSEPYHTYSRPLISYLLCGKTDEQRMKYRPDGYYRKMDCTAMLGRTASRIDPQKKSVFLENGEVVVYDKLMVAAGSRPFVPPMDGLDKVENCFSFMSLDDAKTLVNVLTSSSRVLIIGAGLIGLKCAEGIRDKVKSITVVDLSNRILPSILDEEGSAMVQKHIEKQNVSIILEQSVKEFSPTSALLTSGQRVTFDILVVAVGVRPNIDLLAAAGAKVERGVLTDDCCRTSLKDIYAAGDCTQSMDITTGQSRILALLPNAYAQGECAGIHMAGGEKRYNKAIPMNAVGFFGLHIITAGNYDGEAYITREQDAYKKLVVKNNLLKGYILIGDIQRAGIYTSLIRERTPLDTIDFQLIREKPQLMAFSRAERERKLGENRI